MTTTRRTEDGRAVEVCECVMDVRERRFGRPDCVCQRPRPSLEHLEFDTMTGGVHFAYDPSPSPAQMVMQHADHARRFLGTRDTLLMTLRVAMCRTAEDRCRAELRDVVLPYVERYRLAWADVP